MRVYIIGNDGITLCREVPEAINDGETAVASKEELHAARLSGRRLLQLWNALPGVDKRKKIGDREALLDDLWSAIEALPEPDPEPQSDAKRPSKQQAVIAPAAAARGRNRRRSGERNGLAAPHGARPLLGNPEEEARTDPFLDHRGARPGLPHYRAGAGMSRAIQDTTVCREALARLPELDLGELRQQWRVLYQADASSHLSRELLLRAVAYRMQEIILGGLRPERQRQLREFAREFNETGKISRRARLELKSGTRLVREWQGRTYEMLVLDDGFSWQGTHYRSLSALAKRITGTAWSGPLFFGLKTSRSATRCFSQITASGFTTETDWLLEGNGFEPSIPGGRFRPRRDAEIVRHVLLRSALGGPAPFFTRT